MLKTNTTTKHPQYTYKKGSIFYYSRAVPKDVISYYSTKRIVYSLRTKSIIQAGIMSRAFSGHLEQYWLSLRLKNIELPISQRLKLNAHIKDSNYPLISESKKLYLSAKGKGRSKLFFDSTNRNIKYLIDCLGDNHLDCLTSKDAAKFRDWLLNKGLGTSSVQRVFSGIKAVISFVILEYGLSCNNPFTGIYIHNNQIEARRHPISRHNIAKIQYECIKLNDEIRWLIAIVSDTGMRLSEAVGLKTSDLILDAEIPYVIVQPHPHRRLKTVSSRRKIPLVGAALWGADQVISNSKGAYCFPRYASDSACNSNSASASLNKWIKIVSSKNDVIHGFRHSFRDRLRATEAPNDLIDQLGGWTPRSTGQAYGRGYDLELMQKYMLQVLDIEKHKPIGE
jgi:integrase